MYYIFIIIVGVIAPSFMKKRTDESLHISQLEGYEYEHYLAWIKNNRDKAYSLNKNNRPVKKPLVMTNRAKRLFNTNYVINIIFFIITAILFVSLLRDYIAILLMIIVLGILYYLQPLTMALATLVMEPIEKKINMGFYVSAQKKIKTREDLKVVGITGSFGKTSTKFIVGAILEEKFNVLNTPESYNTPMGLSKVINNELSSEHEVFIAEMGAKKIGEIREVAQLAQPQIGVLTSIGPVHLETFKNIDNILKTKYELIEELPTDGIAIFNYDNEYIKKLADKTFKEKILYGMENTENLDIYADDIEVSELGSRFTLKDKEGNSVRCKTKLLGKHNIYNILAGACVGKALGLTFEEIARGIDRIEPIPHRLNIINPGTGIIVIDDAFNSNPIGSKAALEVISQFKEGKKIIVTPGMIELGEIEESANREFGVNIGKVCDYVILVGEKRTRPIYEGLMETNYNKSNIFTVNNLDEATVQIAKIAKPKDVVLFENDLPDNYSE
ncbi:UDP-N-acetylmuramoyl-tripeptide--D-alanyl-D-alanine ligase [Tissierellaceae bacterium BX21]|uniref:UDP-N-acetylmuramoyl-tripeptide--D-alanyl-D-alanine ligase n=2 Tax=Paratissierella segnis TaxID=2763679 RepID=A0A926EVW6_9FIRM|nr:UDP-N-acetylmuramoyl-tripeptide--D-alanyl-D-alanine ligase [Paratissierella segnis]